VKITPTLSPLLRPSVSDSRPPKVSLLSSFCLSVYPVPLIALPPFPCLSRSPVANEFKAQWEKSRKANESALKATATKTEKTSEKKSDDKDTDLWSAIIKDKKLGLSPPLPSASCSFLFHIFSPLLFLLTFLPPLPFSLAKLNNDDLKNLFAQFDKDKSGSICASELGNLFTAMIKAMFKAMDVRDPPAFFLFGSIFTSACFSSRSPSLFRLSTRTKSPRTSTPFSLATPRRPSSNWTRTTTARSPLKSSRD
jgi:hypothetical protein